LKQKGNKMELIATGVLLAIGFYLAPLIIAGVVAIAGLIGLGICRLFSGCKD
jgi:hypothetical protein